MPTEPPLRAASEGVAQNTVVFKDTSAELATLGAYAARDGATTQLFDETRFRIFALKRATALTAQGRSSPL